MSPLDPGLPAESPPRPTTPPEFLGRVMDSVASSPPPSAPRSFLDAARERSVREAAGALVVAAYLARRGRVPAVVRLQAFVLVVIVAVIAGSGATLAATAAVQVAAPMIGFGDAGVRDGRPTPTATPAATETTGPLVVTPAEMDESRIDDGPTTDSNRRPWSQPTTAVDKPNDASDADADDGSTEPGHEADDRDVSDDEADDDDESDTDDESDEDGDASDDESDDDGDASDDESDTESDTDDETDHDDDTSDDPEDDEATEDDSDDEADEDAADEPDGDSDD